MKYIRTKNGIYDKSKIICSAFREEYCSPNWNEDIEKYLQEKIIKEANTIEELRDEYVAIDEESGNYIISIYTLGNKKYVYINEESGEPLLETFIKNKTVYGSIWVDGNLIKVAKVNDEGELELL